MNKKVGEGLASAIDAGEKATKATKATKESLGTLQTRASSFSSVICSSPLGSTAAETKEKAEHASDQKANQVYLLSISNKALDS